jgi:hypothetical protein
MTVTSSRAPLLNRALAHGAAGAIVILFACAAAAQSQDPQLGAVPATEPQIQQLPQTEPPPRSRPTGLFGAIGRWVDDSIATVATGWSSARDAVGGFGGQATEAARGAAGAARDAATAVMPPTALVSGRVHCVRAANGGPDCQAATEALCRQKGYTSGSSLHIQSEQKCPVWGWIAGEKPVGQCGTETYVTSAMCR